MTHVLDTYPLDFSRQEVRDLRTHLMQTFDSGDSVKALLRDSGIDTAYVNTARDMRLVWTDALDVARKQDRLRVLLSTATIPEPIGSAIRPILDDLLSATPAASTEPRDSIEWKIAGAVESGLERIIESESTLLDISFLERGLKLSPSVAKLVVTLSDQKRLYGTAFRIGADLLLTNHHVLFDAIGPATAVEASFGYEVAFSGVDRAHTVLPCRTDSIVGRIDHDWAVVRTEGEMPTSAGVVALSGAPPPKPRPGLHHPASAGRGEEDRDDPQRRHGRNRRRPAVPDRHRRRLVRLSRLQRAVAGRRPAPSVGEHGARRAAGVCQPGPTHRSDRRGSEGGGTARRGAGGLA